MYEVQYRSWYDRPYPEWLRAQMQHAQRLTTLEEAKQARICSGDLVIETATGKIVTDPSWLFDWENQDPNCYAQKAIAWQKRVA